MWIRSVVGLALAGILGGHAPASPVRELTRQQAVALALAGHPDLRAQTQMVTAAGHQAEALALAPAWTVAGELENVLGSGAVSGVHGAEATLRLGRVIELGGKREARERLGAAEVAREVQQGERQRVIVAARAAERHIAVVALQQRLAILRSHLALAEQSRDALARWIAAGRASDAEAGQAEVVVIGARLRVEDADHELDSARVALAALWGDFEAAFEASGSLDELPAVASYDELAARLPASADQGEFALQAGALAAQREVAASAAKPDVAVNIGIRRLEAIDDQALVMGVSLPLGSAPRSAPGVARVDAELDALAARRQAAQWDARQRLYGLYQELQHARHVVETHRRETLPAAEAALAASQRGFELGRFGFMSLQQAQQTLLDLRLTILAGQQRYHTLLVGIERLTGADAGDAP